MTTPFTARDAKLSRAVDRAFGERFTVVAMAAAEVNARPMPDPERGAQQFIASYAEPGTTIYPKAVRAADDAVNSRAAGKPCVDVETAKLAWRPREGDGVTRHHDGSTHIVAYVSEDGFERTFIYLTSKKAA